jgi:hypothetical protein
MIYISFAYKEDKTIYLGKLDKSGWIDGFKPLKALNQPSFKADRFYLVMVQEDEGSPLRMFELENFLVSMMVDKPISYLELDDLMLVGNTMIRNYKNKTTIH